MIRWQALALMAVLAATPAAATTYYLTVAGIGGEEDYNQRFTGWASDIEKALQKARDGKVETLRPEAATRVAVRAALDRIAKAAKPEDAFVLMLIGHGSFDGTDYKVNLKGPDMTASEVSGLLDKIPAKRQLVVNMTSCSGASLPVLRKENRVVISATKSGTERNATVFARYWAEALHDPAADSDKNDTVSALEAYRYADQKTTKFYESQQRLATEHPMLEDTGKGEGVRAPSTENGYGLLASRFPLLRGGAAAASGDPAKQKLRARKEQVEQEIDRLKYQKAALPLEVYRKQLGALVLELAKVQAELDK